MTATPIPLAALTRDQLDVVLRGNVQERAILIDRVAQLLVAIDARTQRIEQLLERRADAPA